MPVVTTLRSVIDDYMMGLVTLSQPDWFINPTFKTILASNSTEICNAVPLSFAPGLVDVLKADAPPSTDFFTSLPTFPQKYWVVYAALLVKEDCAQFLYIGSSTSVQGHHSRIRTYKDKTHHQLPVMVRAKYEQGYKLGHIGLLCWSPVPTPSIVPQARLKFLAVEVVFTCIFFTAVASIMDSTWSDLVPWNRLNVPWNPLNTHLLSMKAPGGISN